MVNKVVLYQIKLKVLLNLEIQTVGFILMGLSEPTETNEIKLLKSRILMVILAIQNNCVI